MITIRRDLAAVILAAAVLFSGLGVHAAWIPAKALLAQHLIKWSWERTERGEPDARPWPWADTRGIALLRFPHLGIEQVLLAGDSSRNLAFGPVLSESLLRGDDWVISGHRDTHFRFLPELRPGDRVEIVRNGIIRRFRVQGSDIIDSRTNELVVEPGLERISLVSCYPFDATAPGGPLRFVVTALPERPGIISPH